MTKLNQDWQAIAVVGLSQVVISTGVLAVAPLTPFIQEELGLTRAWTGSFVSVLFVEAMRVAFPAGRMVDRYGPRPTVIAGMFVLGRLLVAASLSRSRLFMSGLLALVGIAQGLSSPTLTTVAHPWVSSSIRGTDMGIKHSGAPRGAVLSAAVLPAVALMTTWRWALGFTCGNCSECVDYCPGGAITGRC